MLQCLGCWDGRGGDCVLVTRGGEAAGYVFHPRHHDHPRHHEEVSGHAGDVRIENDSVPLDSSLGRDTTVRVRR